MFAVARGRESRVPRLSFIKDSAAACSGAVASCDWDGGKNPFDTTHHRSLTTYEQHYEQTPHNIH